MVSLILCMFQGGCGIIAASWGTLYHGGIVYLVTFRSEFGSGRRGGFGLDYFSGCGWVRLTTFKELK